MRTPDFGVSKEGVPFILFAAFAALILAVLDWDLLACAMLVLCFFILHFFRDPERVLPVGSGLAVAPADGKIIRIEQCLDPVSGNPVNRVCIFMNIFNVHVNRSPVRGQVESISYHPGAFFNASLDKASEQNEQNILSLIDEQGRRVSMVQISGLIARRIICRAEPEDQLHLGQRLGLIKFGSRVDLYLPKEYALRVQTGTSVFAGQTLLAES